MKIFLLNYLLSLLINKVLVMKTLVDLIPVLEG